MELYTSTSYQLSEQLTKRYSTSFSLSTRLFSETIRPHIYAIYGLVRIADEIVDTYRGLDAGSQLEYLHKDTILAIETGYSTNPIVHAYADTARHFNIGEALINPFFESMQTDLTTKIFNPRTYSQYIYGSAEVVGLMCLKVFTNDEVLYKTLQPGARSLGAAYQKVNFLRDIGDDYHELQRIYFPDLDFNTFSDSQKLVIVNDIEKNFKDSMDSIQKIPKIAQKAVYASFLYYSSLLELLKKTSVEDIKKKRIRISNIKKIYIYLKVSLWGYH